MLTVIFMSIGWNVVTGGSELLLKDEFQDWTNLSKYGAIRVISS